jgi:23S rRNA (guanosine2251-2'-O)-methyltransferase
MPIIRTVNISRTLADLKEDGFWVVGLDERADKTIGQVDFKGKMVIVMGAEGSGMRKLIRENCDFLAKLPTNPNFPTLNVSTATAITLYEWNRQNS